MSVDQHHLVVEPVNLCDVEFVVHQAAQQGPSA